MTTISNQIPSLQALCQPIVVNCIEREVYSEIRYQLNSAVSRELFDSLYTPNAAIKNEVRSEVEMKFDINQFVLGHNNLDWAHRQLAYSKNFEKLELLDLSRKEALFMKAKKGDGMKQKGRPFRMNIVSVLKRFLNPQSRKMLNMLAINGSKVVFPPGWMTALTRMLPSLKSLDLSNCHLTNNDLSALYGSELPLEKLSISQTDVTSFKGIGALKSLKILCAADLKMMEPEDLENLENLQVLDISSRANGSVKAADFLISCGSLPKLTFLDVSGNVMGIGLANQFLEKHPSLSTIVLIDSDDHSDMVPEQLIRKINLFTVTDFPSCVDSLAVFKSDAAKCKLILGKVHNYLLNESDELGAEDVRRCAQCLPGVLRSSAQNFVNKAKAVRCLFEIADDAATLARLTLEDKKKIIDAIWIAIQSAYYVSQNVDTEPDFEFVAWTTNLLSSTNFLVNAKLEKEVCRIYMWMLENSMKFTRPYSNSWLTYLIDHKQVVLTSQPPTPMTACSILGRILDTFPNQLTENEYKRLLDFGQVMLTFESLDYKDFGDYMEKIFKRLLTFSDSDQIVKSSFECIALLYKETEESLRKKIFEQFDDTILKAFIRSEEQYKRSLVFKLLLDIESFHADKTFDWTLLETEITRIIIEFELKGQPVEVIFQHLCFISEHPCVGWWVEKIQARHFGSM